MMATHPLYDTVYSILYSVAYLRFRFLLCVS